MSTYGTINIKADVKNALNDLGSFKNELNQKQIMRATSRAINDCLRDGKTDAKRAIKKVYTIAERGMDRALDIDRSTTYPHKGKVVGNTFLTGAIIASAKPVPADLFKLSFSYKSGSTSTISKKGVQKTKLNTRGKSGGGVTFEAIKGQVEVYSHAFLLPTMSGRVFARGAYKTGGNYGFVQRMGKGSRLPFEGTGNDSVKGLIGPSVYLEAINPNTQKIIMNHIEPKYAERMWAHLGLIISGIRS